MRCSLLTPRAQLWLASSRSARILQLFGQVINLVNDRGDVVSLSSPALGLGPFTVVVDGDFLSQLQQIELHDPISIDLMKSTISVGKLTIELDQAAVWDPVPPWSQLSGRLPDYDPNTISLPAEVRTRLESLIKAILADDRDGIIKATVKIAGLGSGLTPAGDDALIGLLFALWVCNPELQWRVTIAETAAPLTTTLSAAYLRAAAAGEATIHWHHLVSGQPQAIDEILAIGHSSGQDAWTGFIITYNKLILSTKP